MKVSCVFVLVVLLFSALLMPNVKATISEHVPSSYEVIDDGWLNPDGVYEVGDSLMGTSENIQTVNFSGFNFDIPLTATVDAVFIHYLGSVAFVSSLIFSFSGYAKLTFGLINGSVLARDFFGLLYGEEYFDVSAYDEPYNSFNCNVTSIYGNVEALNNLEISVTANLDDCTFLAFSIDYLTVTVAYSTESNFAEGIFIGALILGAISLFAFLFLLAKKHT